MSHMRLKPRAVEPGAIFTVEVFDRATVRIALYRDMLARYSELYRPEVFQVNGRFRLVRGYTAKCNLLEAVIDNDGLFGMCREKEQAVLMRVHQVFDVL